MRFSAPVLTGWTARLLAAACALLNTRLLIDLMGVDDFAAVTIVLSLMPWFALLNLGLPSAAQNAIARQRASASRDVSSLVQTSVDAAFLAVLLLLPVALALAALVQHVLLASHAALPYAWAAILCCALLFNGFALVFNQVLYATHRALWPSVAPAAQAALTTLCLLLAIKLHLRDPLLGALAIAAPMVVVFTVSAHRVGAWPRLPVDGGRLRSLVSGGRGFLMFGVTAQATLACDYVVMALLLSSDTIVQYSLASRSFGVILTLHAVLLATSWTPMSDRYFRGDLKRLRLDVRRLLIGGAALTLGMTLPLALCMDRVVALLSGAKTPPLPISLIAMWTLYLLLRVWSDTFATALLSFNELRKVNKYVAVQACISVPSQWILATHFGATGIVMGIIISFVATAVWLLPLRFMELTRTPLNTV